MTAKMEASLKALKEEMSDLNTEETTVETKAKKAVKKAPAKKAAAKPEPAPKKKTASKKAEDGTITLKDLAKEAKLEPHIARRQLRKAGIPNEGRWTWADGTPALRKAREALGLG